MATAMGKPFDCKHCGLEVVWAVSKNNKKYLASIKNWSGDEVAITIAFYPAHECDRNAERAAERAAIKKAALDEKLSRGLLIKGQTVTVVKGRKVPKGTTGVIVWEGEPVTAYSKTVQRIGIKDAEGNMHYTASSNVVATNQLKEAN